MGKLIDILTKIKDNPEDLSELATAIEHAKEMEENDSKQLEQIGKLQENYRKVIKMIPVPEAEEPKAEEPKQPTIEDAVKEIQENMKGEF